MAWPRVTTHGKMASEAASTTMPTANSLPIGQRPASQPATRFVGSPLTTSTVITMRNVLASSPWLSRIDLLKSVIADQTRLNKAVEMVNVQNAGEARAAPSVHSSAGRDSFGALASTL